MATLCSDPGLEIGNERRDAVASHGETLADVAAIDLPPDVEDRVNTLDRLDGGDASADS